VIRTANSVSHPMTPWRRSLSSIYSNVLYGLSGGRGLDAEINGGIYRIDPRFRWRLWPEYEADLAAVLRARVRPGFCCIDVGANIGIYVLQMARWSSPDGRIIAFEPNPKTFEVLKRHVRMNDLGGRVALVPMAAGRQTGRAKLYDVQAGSGLSRLDNANPATVGPVAATDVQLTTIDEYCARSGVRPDLILVDVEGFEFDVLAGAAETIRRARPQLFVELHPHLYPDGEASRATGARLIAELGLRPVPVGNARRDPWSVGCVSLEAV
jgi:FkbM family methyltransferase